LNDVYVNDPSLSNIHAEISRDYKGNLFLEDKQSKHQTFVARDKPLYLKEGETVFIQIDGTLIPIRAESKWDVIFPYGPQLYHRSDKGYMQQIPWLSLPTEASSHVANIIAKLQLVAAGTVIPILMCLLVHAGIFLSETSPLITFFKF